MREKVRKTITMEVKFKILKLKDRGCAISSIAREHNLSRTTVQIILKDKERLLTLNYVASNNTIIQEEML